MLGLRIQVPAEDDKAAEQVPILLFSVDKACGDSAGPAELSRKKADT